MILSIILIIIIVIICVQQKKKSTVESSLKVPEEPFVIPKTINYVSDEVESESDDEVDLESFDYDTRVDFDPSKPIKYLTMPDHDLITA